VGKNHSDAIALIVLGLILLNGHYLIEYVPGDGLKGTLLFLTIAAGICCTVIGALRLFRKKDES